ncbi:hypothetical protein KAZ66_04795 [Candidatus Woesebacteria bacterium]|nr:hypothetical protein [Candidatus Woesebacteria bacterium]
MSQRIVQIGLGVVGSAYALAYAHFGNSVYGIDINPERINFLSSNGIQAYHPSHIPAGLSPDIITISINTPLQENGRLCLTWLEKAMTDSVATLIGQSRKPPVVVVRSTVPPGTTESYIALLEQVTGKKEGMGFFMAFQPEFLRAKSAFEDAMNPWRVIIGTQHDVAAETLATLYRPMIADHKIEVCSIQTAELHKLAHNFANATKISYANHIFLLAAAIGVDGSEVLKLVAQTAEAMRNPMYGMTPGTPFGGVCLPKDTSEIHGWSEEIGVPNSLPAAVLHVNEILLSMADPADSPNWVSSAELR